MCTRWQKGISADVPLCRTYTPVGLKSVNKRKKENEKEAKKKRRRESIFRGRMREIVWVFFYQKRPSFSLGECNIRWKKPEKV